MLKHLFIQNYTLIETLNLDFNHGFSAITGETGAGKSIIIGALGLILGKRSDSSVLLRNDKKCIVEGTFYIEDYHLNRFFEKHELDYENNTILRREINTNGKSRAFINDTPVNLNVLKDFTENLIDIHSQHETLTINNALFQLKVVDNYAGLQDDTIQYRKVYADFKRTEKKLNELTSEYLKNKADIHYFQFQFDELDKAKFNEGEQEDAEKQLDILNHAEEIKVTLNQLNQILSLTDNNIISQLSQIENKLVNTADYHPKIKELKDRIHSIIIELNDISSESEQLDEDIEYSTEQSNELNERLDLIYKLQQKHNVSTIAELLLYQKDLEEKINNIETSEYEIESLKEKFIQKKKQVDQIADKISLKRKEAIPEIEKKIKATLSKLGIKDAVFKIKIENLSEANETGKDLIRFYFNANPGLVPNELSKVASGGELSRLMLSIKSIISQRSLLPTIIFDEIDMGISGEIAGKVGDILQSISTNMQVIAITHLPQIAGKASTHYKVFKEITNEITKSRIQQLNNEERVEEIAKILSGNQITDAALKTAQQLLK